VDDEAAMVANHGARAEAEGRTATAMHMMREPVAGKVDLNDPHHVPPFYDR
jgi:hypothetical protein